MKNYGALTAKPSAFRYRPWEIQEHAAIDLHDSFGSNITVYTRGTDIMRILPRINTRINKNLITDKVRFSFDARLNQRLLEPLIRLYGREQSIFKLTYISHKFATDLFTRIINEEKDTHVFFGPHTSIEQTIAITDAQLELFNKKRMIPITPRTISIKTDYLPATPINKLSTPFNGADVVLLLGAELRVEMPLMLHQLEHYLNEDASRTCYTLFCDAPSLPNVINLGATIDDVLNNSAGKSYMIRSALKGRHVQIITGSGLIQPISSLFLVEMREGLTKWLPFLRIAAAIRPYASTSYDLPSIVTTFRDRMSVNETFLAYLYNNAFEFVKNEGRVSQNILSINFDNLEETRKRYAKVLYLGAHLDTVYDDASLALPIPAMYEHSGTYLNYEFLMQFMPRILKHEEMEYSLLDPFLIESFFANTLKKQNFKRIKQRIMDLGFQHNYAGLFAPELISQYKFKVFRKENLANFSKLSQILRNDSVFSSSIASFVPGNKYIDILDMLSTVHHNKFNLTPVGRYTKRHKFNCPLMYTSAIENTNVILDRTKSVVRTTHHDSQMTDAFTRSSINLALAALHFTRSELNFKL